MSDNPYYIYGEKKSKSSSRVSIEEPEGIDTVSLPRDKGGKPRPGAVSLTKISVGDLICEGEIDGLVTADYTYVGNVGSVGWTSATPSTYATPVGGTNWLRSIFWNEVPVVNSQNEYNFTDINVGFTPGLPAGRVLNSTTSDTTRISDRTTISRGIGERLRYGTDFAKTYRILNKNCIEVEVNIKIGQLSATSKDKSTYGDLVATEVLCKIYSRPIYSSSGNEVPFRLIKSPIIKGKISNGFILMTSIPLREEKAKVEEDLLGYEIKIERATPDSIESAIRNQTYIDSLTEVYGDVYAYPCSAIVSSKFSAEFFSAVPSRAYDVKLLKVKVPSNYDPIKKVYGEANGGPVGTAVTWDGTFSDTKQWTDNPAWCYYDLITNARYGLGKYIDPDFVDKWTLYSIGQYCDTIVNNGEGGKEPRFTCNLIINSREDAYKVVNDFASIFRAITYYGAGSIFAVQDSLKAPTWQFTNASVENGDFLYSSTSRRARNTVAMVRYNDKTNFYKPAVEYVEDIDGIRKYGIREVDLTAFGCTSRGQAIRYGRWALLSETLETESVSFTVGSEGARIAPGDVIQTFDANRHESRYGGRLEEAIQFGTKTRLTLDSYITGFVPANYYKISVLTPTYTYDPSIVSDLDSADVNNVRRSSLQTRTFLGSYASGITGLDSGVRTDISFLNEPGGFNEGFNVTDYDISGRYVWMIENSGNSTDIASNVWDYWRALRIEEQEDGVKYSISAIEYNEDKFYKIESGLAFQQPNYGETPVAPEKLSLSIKSLTQNSKLIHYEITASNLLNVAGYLVYVKRNEAPTTNDSTYLVNRLPAQTTEGDYFPSQNGTYHFAVHTVNQQGTKSTNSVINQIDVTNVNPIRDITISSLVVSTGTYNLANQAGDKDFFVTDDIDPVFRWQTSINNSVISAPADLQYRITFREPAGPGDQDLPSSNIYYQVTGWKTSDFTYQLEFSGNKGNLVDSVNSRVGPFRNYDVIVEAHTPDGDSSAGNGTITRIPPETERITYNNSYGFDILNYYNPPINRINLDPENVTTDQWITPDGDVKINIPDQTIPDDLAGAIVYTSTKTFTERQAKLLDVADATIRAFDVEDATSETIIVSPKYHNVDEAYVAVAFYDTFDEALKDYGVNLATLADLQVSNAVKIVKRGAAKRQSIFNAWIELVFTINAGVTPTNLELVVNGIDYSNNYNIKSFSYSKGKYEVIMNNEIADGRYSIFQGFPDTTVGIASVLTPEVSDKQSDRFYITIPQAAYNRNNGLKRLFFGVLIPENVSV